MKPFIFLDIETTGKDPAINHIIEIACQKWADGKCLGKFESLVKPGVPVPYEITLLTGITDKDLINAPSFSKLKEDIKTFLGDFPVVGHNISFDMSFLRSHHLEIENPEIDTVRLAEILLLKEPSYALEVLVKKYGLQTAVSHRAMADVGNTIAFFEFLEKKILELPEKTLKTMQAFLEKTNWPAKEIFLDRRSRKQKPATASPVLPADPVCSADLAPSAGHPQAAQEINWADPTAADFLSGKKILLESIGQIPFEKLKSQPLIVAYSSSRKRDEILASAEHTGLQAGLLKEPDFYISPKRLGDYLARDTFSDGDGGGTHEEIPFLLKVIHWADVTKTGDREEITFNREDYGLFENVADVDGTDKFYKQAFADAKKNPVVLVHQYGLARGLPDLGKRALVVTEASRLEESFTNAYRGYFTENKLRPIFREKAAMVFGLIGIFYEKYSKELSAAFGDTADGNLIFNEGLYSSAEWKRVTETINHLPEHRLKEKLTAAVSPEQNFLKWISSFADEIVFHSVPVWLEDAFIRATAPFEKIALQSGALSLNGDFALVRELFGLDSDWQEIREPVNYSGNLKIKTFPEFPAPFDEGYFKKNLELFIKIINEYKGRCLFLLSSKKMVEAIYRALLPQSQKAGVKLLALGLSGGAGKSMALFNENPASSVLLTTNQIMPHIQQIEDNIDVIVFQKIPFDPPGDPLARTRAAQFENGFKQYTLPRAAIKFRELLIEFGRGGSSSDKIKTCYLLDSRLLTRDYGQLLLSSL